MAPKYTKALLAATYTLVAASLSAATADLLLQGNGVHPIGYVDPGTLMSYDFRIHNSGPDPAEPRFILPLPNGARFASAADSRWLCSEDAAAVVCTHPAIAKGEDVAITVNFFAPTDPRGLWANFSARIESDTPDPHPDLNSTTVTLIVYRTFTVSTPDDFGAGSLRGAIESANADCDGSVPCKIRFERAMRIVPRSPLPALTGCSLTVDGGVYDVFHPTPTRYFDLPRCVEIAGDEVESGSGLLVTEGCKSPYFATVTLNGLAIGGFPENGVEMRNASLAVQGCFIGTDATGTTAVPNRLRGIAATTALGSLSVADSLIAGNARSGVAVYAAYLAQFSGNLIGVRFGGVPMPNGASGVYLAGGRVAKFSRNIIEYNREFGIAIAPAVQHVASDGDYIIGNGGLAIDRGLDGPSADRLGPPAPPRITDAFFDEAQGATIVRGDLLLQEWPQGPFGVRVVLTEGDYQGGLLLKGQATTISRTPQHSFVFETVVPGDWRGQRLSAQALYADNFFDGLEYSLLDSSEFTAGIVVR